MARVTTIGGHFEEAARALLRESFQRKSINVSALERGLGVRPNFVHEVLRSRVDLRYGVLCAILDAAEIPRDEFFRELHSAQKKHQAADRDDILREMTDVLRRAEAELARRDGAVEPLATRADEATARPRARARR